MAKKILMVIASKNFRDEELLVPKANFEKSGFDVVIAGSSLKPAKGMLGAVVTPQILVQDAKIDGCDALVFVGGNGAQEYWDNAAAHQIAQNFGAAGKIVSAICIAPVILANAGLLKGKKTTVWPSEVSRLAEKGAILKNTNVVQDGNIITANGPQAAEEFAKTIIRSLS